MSAKPKPKPKPKPKTDSLIAAIQRKAPSSAPAAPETAPSETETAAPEGRRTSRVGKPVQFWLHDEDRRLVRELSAWLAGQGERPTDSMVIRSALRIARTDAELLNAYRQASQLDGRLKQHRIA
jgi:hypothetical protein